MTAALATQVKHAKIYSHSNMSFRDLEKFGGTILPNKIARMVKGPPPGPYWTVAGDSPFAFVDAGLSTLRTTKASMKKESSRSGYPNWRTTTVFLASPSWALVSKRVQMDSIVKDLEQIRSSTSATEGREDLGSLTE